ncbi:MAG TPA: ATP-binding protein [Polyangiaceae bacterium]
MREHRDASLARLISEFVLDRHSEPIVVDDTQGGSYVVEGFPVGDFVVMKARGGTERRPLEDELGRLRRIEALALLTASVIHDFNNLMTPMLALSGSLAGELQSSSRTRELVSDIESIASRTAALFRDLVKVTKPRQNPPVAVEVDRVVAAMQPLFERLVGTEVELVVSVETAARISVERSRFERALLNLVSNAQQAMPGGGTLTIGVSRVPARDGEAPMVELVVRDTGEGMTDFVRTHACDDFFTTRDGSGGTGLGLSSVKRFVSDSSGEIRLESAPGRGTTVVIRLPEV